MISLFPLLISFLMLHSWVIPVYGQDQPRTGIKEIAIEELPSEARTTLRLIEKGGPFPYQRDGAVFGNFERRLPIKNAVTIENLPYRRRGVVIGAPGVLSPVKTVNAIIPRIITGHSTKFAKACHHERKKAR